jgi:hypothetical protein
MAQRAVKGSAKPSKARRWAWLALLALIVVFAFAVQDAVRKLLDVTFIESQFADAMSRATNGLYRIQIGDLKYSLLKNRLTASNVRIHPDSGVLRDSLRRAAPEGLYSISAPALTMTGTNVWALLKGKLDAGSLHLVRPHLHLALDSRRVSPENLTAAETYRADDTLARSEAFHVRLARQLPQMSINYLRIDSGAFSWERNVGGRVLRDSVGSISVEMIDINTDSVSATDVHRVLFSDDVRFRVGSYSRITEDGVYLVTADSLSGSTLDSAIAIHSLRIFPVLSDSQLKKKWSHRTTRYRTSVDEVALNGIDLRNLFDESNVAVGSMSLRKPELDVYLDKTLPTAEDKPPAKLPHQSLQGVSWNVRFDTINIENGRLVYSERAKDGARPGVIRFEELTGEMLHVSNERPEKGQRNIASLAMRARVNGAGRLAAKLEYDMSARGLQMSYKGSISAMDASVFNEVLVDLEGIKVSKGRVDTAWFNISVANDSATGQMQLLYHDLAVSFMNKQTGRVSLIDKLKGFVANTMKLKSGNPPSSDKPPSVADIALRRPAEIPLFGFVWISIRQGLLATLGIN